MPHSAAAQRTRAPAPQRALHPCCASCTGTPLLSGLPAQAATLTERCLPAFTAKLHGLPNASATLTERCLHSRRSFMACQMHQCPPHPWCASGAGAQSPPALPTPPSMRPQGQFAKPERVLKQAGPPLKDKVTMLAGGNSSLPVHLQAAWERSHWPPWPLWLPCSRLYHLQTAWPKCSAPRWGLARSLHSGRSYWFPIWWHQNLHARGSSCCAESIWQINDADVSVDMRCLHFAALCG